MKRKVILSKDAVLWEAGDAAKTFAILESGKLGVKTDKGLAGVIYPNMVLGESAIMSYEGEKPRRTASVIAFEENTTVTEYPAHVVKQGFDGGQNPLAKAVLTTLIGHISRNCLVLMTAHKLNPFIALPFKSLMQSLVQTYKAQIAGITSWEDFLFTFQFLSATRDYTEQMQQKLMIASADKDAVFKASEITHDFFKGRDELTFVKEFLTAEQERRDWIERNEK